MEEEQSKAVMDVSAIVLDHSWEVHEQAEGDGHSDVADDEGATKRCRVSGEFGRPAAPATLLWRHESGNVPQSLGAA